MAAKNGSGGGWTDYAVLVSSHPGSNKEWTVQSNGEGALRCNCPSWIYSRSPKSCKHCRICDGQLPPVGKMAQDRVDKAPDPPFWNQATELLTGMLKCGGLVPNARSRKKMTEFLATNLAVFNPTPEVEVAMQTDLVTGVRRITFDD